MKKHENTNSVTDIWATFDIKSCIVDSPDCWLFIFIEKYNKKDGHTHLVQIWPTLN